MKINEFELLKTRRILAEHLINYIEIIKKNYKTNISDENLKFLDNIDEYEDIIKIKDTNTISMFVRNKKIYFPLNAYKTLNLMSKIPGFGSNKNHRAYSNENLIINDNQFNDYIKHVFISGLSPLEFYLETLLHESLHLCGAGGTSPLREGFTELKTRELALKYNLITSGCGYPKELKIAYELQNILGKEIGNKITFAKNKQEIFNILSNILKPELVDLYFKIETEMMNEFNKYYGKDFSGILGPFKKSKAYKEINYEKIYFLLEQYYISNKKFKY